MFGGVQLVHGVVNDVYIVDLTTMECTNLEKPEGAPWPAGRMLHAACCLNYGDKQPVLLMTGGVAQNRNTLNDAWLLDVHSRRWKELNLPEGTQPRWGHTLTSHRIEKNRVLATLEDDRPKLTATTVLEFESVQCGNTPSSREWVLMGVADSSQMGTPKRAMELEMKQKRTKHGKWSSAPTTGPSPPPRAFFTNTAVNQNLGVMFGGVRQVYGVVNDVYIIDLTTMGCTKLEKPKGVPWPAGRMLHAACCLNYGEERPVLLMTGGVAQNRNTLHDAWLLDVHSRRWRKVREM